MRLDEPAWQRRAERLQAGARELGVPLQPAQTQRLLAFIALLARWNRSFNLTAVREPDAMLSHHLLDALACLPWVQGTRVLDVGSGAGLPGVVFAVAREALSLTLLDAAAKRTRFLTQVRIELQLHNCEVVQTRAEHYRPGQPFDTLVMRAFTDLRSAVALARPLLVPGGRLLMPKGRYPDAELRALHAPGFDTEVLSLDVPGLRARRHLVVLRDCRNIPGHPSPPARTPS